MQQPNFLIVLFKNNSKKKIINKFITLDRAKKFFKELIDKNEQVIFPKQYENGKKANFELAIISTKKVKDKVSYVKDEFGRQVKLEMENDGFDIVEILPYKIEEEFLNYKTKKKIDSVKLIGKFLNGPGVKLISKLNNKIIVQIDDKYNLFTLKNDSDANRFIDCLSTYFFKFQKKDCIVVKDISITQRKYLYETLVNLGYPKSYLFRHSTTHPTEK